MSQAEERQTKEEIHQREEKGYDGYQDDPESSEDDSEEEQANMALMACIEAHTEKIQSELESQLDSKEVFPNLSHYELESCLFEILENYQKLQNK